MFCNILVHYHQNNCNSGRDIRWKFGKIVDGNKNKIQCNFCVKVITIGKTRLKQHLAHKKVI